MHRYAHKVEVLAPAGNEDSLKAAIDYGADAVYLGVGQYNARSNAQNFTFENLNKWIDYAHLFDVKVYLVLNILLNDLEIEQSFSTAVNAHNMGVDAVIVQDLGLLSVIQRYANEIKIHCSTQMGIHNRLGAKWAKEHGASRIILSRESSIDDIKTISSEVEIELEYFILGALCVCFSGNCYYSSQVSGLSGNRGKCMQLCRKSYSLIKDNNTLLHGHLLSPADQDLTKFLNELINAGVTSFKIEGRMKRPEYVAQAVKMVKTALEKGEPDREENSNLKAMFNRGGYSEGYIKEKPNYGSLIYPKHPSHFGVKIGTINNINKDTATINTAHPIKNDDGFKIFRNGIETGNAYGYNGILKFRGDVKKGDSVNITSSSSLLEKLNSFKRKLKLDFKIIINPDNPIKLFAKSQEIIIDYTSEFLVQSAINAAISEEDIKASIAKLNDTEFVLSKLDIELEDKVFIPKSILNNCRREAVELLRKAIIAKNTPIHSILFDRVLCQNNNSFNYSGIAPLKMLQFSDFSCFFNSQFLPFGDIFIYNTDDYENILNKPNFSKPIYLNLPIIANNRDLALLYSQVDNIKTYDGVVANNVYCLELAKDLGLNCIAGTGLNIFNHYCKEFINTQYFIASPENYAESKDMFLYSYGKFPLMTVKFCPFSISYQTNCKKCSYQSDVKYLDDHNKKLKIRRIKLSRCYFQFIDDQGLFLPKKERGNLVFFDFTDYNKKDIIDFLENDNSFQKKKNYFSKVK